MKVKDILKITTKGELITLCDVRWDYICSFQLEDAPPHIMNCEVKEICSAISRSEDCETLVIILDYEMPHIEADLDELFRYIDKDKINQNKFKL